MHRSPVYATVPCASGRRHALAVHEASPPEPAKPRLLDRVRAAARLRHYSRRTEAAYVAWIRRYIFFHGKRHPAELGAAEVTRNGCGSGCSQPRGPTATVRQASGGGTTSTNPCSSAW
jgi:hypothetical protein